VEGLEGHDRSARDDKTLNGAATAAGNDLSEAIDTMRLHRVAGRTGVGTAVVTTRPYRTPTRSSRMLG
jgi:hypothetical protein